MSTRSLLKSAQDILEDRELDYGPSCKSFKKIAKSWSLFLDKEITPQQVAIMMIYFKLARLSYNPDHFDTHVDIIGYTTLLNNIKGREYE
jgi:hypothetical protein